MPLNKTLQRLVVTGFSRLRAGVKARFGDDGGDEVSVRLDTSRNPSELVFEDENNNTDALRLPIGSDIATELENGGRHEMNVGGLSGDLADRQNTKTHESRHRRGGADELEISDLDASSGTTDDAVLVNSDGSLRYASPGGRDPDKVAEIAEATHHVTSTGTGFDSVE